MTGQGWLAVAALLAGPITAESQQTTATLEVGSARMRFADSLDASTVSLTPAFRVVGARGTFSATGTLSQLSGASSNSGLLDVTLSRRRGPVGFEVEGLAGGSMHSDGTRTGQTLGLARLHFAGTSRGVWGGAGAGQTWDGAWRSVVQGDVGGWVAGAAGSLTVSLSPTIVDDTIKYNDTFVSGHRAVSQWALDASLGLRAGNQIPTLPANRTAWGNLSATYWATSRVGVIASAGTYPVDFTQGFPGGRFVSLSVRLRSAGATPSELPLSALEPPGEAVRGFEARRVTAGSYQVRVRAPAARSVEISGDFTQWAALSLGRESADWWTTTVLLATGIREISVRIDGGSWQVPPRLTVRTDEFGGRVGLLVIP